MARSGWFASVPRIAAGAKEVCHDWITVDRGGEGQATADRLLLRTTVTILLCQVCDVLLLRATMSACEHCGLSVYLC